MNLIWLFAVALSLRLVLLDRPAVLLVYGELLYKHTWKKILSA